MNNLELRIGNNILHNNEPCQVFSLSSEWLRVTKDRSIAVSYDNITGIVLTRDLLLRYGFYQLPHFTVGDNWLMDFGISSQISISCLNSCNLMVWLSSVDETKKPTDLVCLWNWDLRGDLYLHQLQNLYFILTGKELMEIE
jgi:hypothetical protein